MAKRSARRPAKRARREALTTETPVDQAALPSTKARITLFDFAEGHCYEHQLENLDQALASVEANNVTWIDIDGSHDPLLLDRAGQLFKIHPLVLEDVQNTEHRPKWEDNNDYLYVLLKMFRYDAAEKEVVIEQVSFVLRSNLVISFQDRPGDVFDPVRNRLRQARGRIRKLGADYLMYALMDAIVDNYFLVTDKFEEKIEELEDEIVARPREYTLGMLHKLKRELIFLRRAVGPLREVVAGLQRSESALIHSETAIYLRDLHDHVIQVADAIDTSREMLSELLDVQLSILSNRTNGILKVLALFSSIFMPLSFITGIFGMNFKYFPELEWKYGLAGVVAVMAMVAVGMIMFFRSKRWL